ncbi:transcriptional regulator WhiJ [Streptomyces capparidis]
MSARDAGALLGTSQSKMSLIESGKAGISEERVRRLCAHYGCTDRALIDALSAITRERRGQFWWDEYRGILPPSFLDLAELEHHAAYLGSVQMLVIPGLLQTEDYARAVFSLSLRQHPSTDLDARVEHRVRRQQIFEREKPAPYQAVIHEAALRMRYGGAKVMRGQLEHLLGVADRPGTTIRVIPFETEEMTAETESMLYAGFAVPQLDTVEVDTLYGLTFVDSEVQVALYRTTYHSLESISLDPRETRAFIHRVLQEL